MTLRHAWNIGQCIVAVVWFINQINLNKAILQMIFSVIP